MEFRDEYNEQARENDKVILLQTFRKFVEGTIVHGDYNISMETASEDIAGIGMGEQGYYRNKAEFRKLFKESFKTPADNPPNNTVEYDEIDIRIFSPVSATITGKVYITTEINGKKIKNGIMQMASAKKENGEWLFCMLTATPLILTEETIEAYPLAFAEETLTQLSEDIALKNMEMLQTIIDAVPLAVFCKDLNKKYTLYNQFFADFVGVDRHSGIGKSSDDLMKISFDDLNQKTIDEGGKVTIEKWMPSLDGTQRLFEISEVPFIQNGVVVGIVGIAYDITLFKEMQEAALSASRSKSAFLANMSHEMRTPMNVVVGLTDLMLDEDTPMINLKENLKKISTAGNSLLGLINDVLDISKIEAGKLELMPMQYDVPSLISDIITLNMIRLEEKNITFSLDINEELPCSLFGDDLRVKQIINNLLSNAFKYTQQGTVTMGMSCERENDEHVRMSVWISDTGVGIREEDLKKLFTDYSQVDTRANRRLEGTGLGLSITKMLVERMNGKISVESEYGKGSTFRLHIRQGFVSNKTIGAELAYSLRSFSYLDTRKRTHEKLIRPNLSYACVLVVDDMPTNLDVAAGMLRKYKMRVDCVLSGQEAIDRIKEGEPVYDAIFMDHMMPEMDGIETTEKIRKIGTKYAMTVPIIALTANAIAGNEQMFLNNDFQAFLSKPVNIMNLDSIVQRWVRDKSRE